MLIWAIGGAALKLVGFVGCNSKVRVATWVVIFGARRNSRNCFLGRLHCNIFDFRFEIVVAAVGANSQDHQLRGSATN